MKPSLVSQAATTPKEAYETSTRYHEGMVHPYGDSINVFISSQNVSLPAPPPKVAKLEEEWYQVQRQQCCCKLA
jgi:hypothetical protein